MERNTLRFKGEYASGKLALRVGSYWEGRLYIGLDVKTEDGFLPYGDLTVDLPWAPAAKREAYIRDNGGGDLLNFVREHGLGTLLPDELSGCCRYRKAVFNMERLRELDPEGVWRFEQRERNI